MFVQMRRTVVTEGNAHKVVERFKPNPNKPSILEQREGFISREVLVKKTRRGDEEVIVLIRWESEEAWKAWEKSPEHIAGHKKQIEEHGGKPPKPDYVVSSEGSVYYVQ
ncbi:antibiotic biosynthesis monooxygenase family protein [Lysinibacillus sp. NPDC097287]|uniref:antibiotic biosynthesis monooxygenase family protein n=1 Tax=Lysinibacillus sp. NPDC097287 TaxID=3364144 RepID=UPI00381330CA